MKQSIAGMAIIIILNLYGVLFSQEANVDKNTADDKQAVEQQGADETKKSEIKKIAPIVITATKTGINKQETGASITVISSDEIEQKEKMNIVEMLKETPGLSVSSSSPFGGLSELYMRGTGSNHVVVLIDGVKANDPCSPANGFDFAHITTDNIDRIEIIRGSQSTLYGSDAIGGVINIITKKGKRKPQVTIKAEGGSYCTFKEMAGVNGSYKWANFSFALSRTDSQGFSRAATWHSLSKTFMTNDKDGYQNTSASARIGIKAIHKSNLSFAIRYTDTKTEIDDGAFQDDKNHIVENNMISCITAYQIPIFKWWESQLSFSYMSQIQRDRDNPELFEYSYVQMGMLGATFTDMWFKGKRIMTEFKNRFMIKDVDEIICGVSYEKEFAATMPWFCGLYPDPTPPQPMDWRSPIDKSEGNWAGYAQNHLKLFKRIFIITGVRYTRPDHFTKSIDYSVSGSFIVPKAETRLKANVATGFKTPSLYQRFNTFERTDRFTFAYLRSEKSMSYDVGIEQPLWDDKITIEANFFSIDYKNMIIYDTIIDSWGRYYNSDAIIRGVECIGSITPIEDLTIKVNYTLTYSSNKTFHTGELLRRPRHKAGVSVNYAFLKKGNINVGFSYVGKRRDYIEFPYYNYLNPYYKLDAAASWWIIDQLQVFVRVENALNKKYEEIRGYRTAMASAYGGVKAVF